MKSRRESKKHSGAMRRAKAGMTLAFVLAFATMTAWPHGEKARVTASLIPVGTILPVRLEHTLSAEEAKAGQEIEAEIMQDVPLSSHERIKAQSKVHGAVVSVARAASGDGVDVSLRFDKIEYDKKMIPMITSLRAMASYRAVRGAQTPWAGADSGTPAGWGDTVQIGGDIRFGDGGEVRNRRKQKIGKGVAGGVLVHASAAPGSACEGAVGGDDRLQALWVFSADACGVYDYKDIRIIHTGKTDGEIKIRFEKEKMKLEEHTGMLLRTVAAP